MAVWRAYSTLETAHKACFKRLNLQAYRQDPYNMIADIKNFLDKWNDSLEPIKEQALKYFDIDSGIRADKAIQIYKRPWVAPQNFGLLLFPPVEQKWLIEFEKRAGKTIPAIYESVLQQINGCFIYDFSLFGLPESVYSTGLLNRDLLHQFDLTEANLSWIKEYDVNRNWFHFGSRAYSDEENIGFFIDYEDILSVRANGEILNNYKTIRDFLDVEIGFAEQMMLTEKNENN